MLLVAPTPMAYLESPGEFADLQEEPEFPRAKMGILKEIKTFVKSCTFLYSDIKTYMPATIQARMDSSYQSSSEPPPQEFVQTFGLGSAVRTHWAQSIRLTSDPDP
jgi:hypothetical protein